jgi:hypothetical protein
LPSHFWLLVLSFRFKLSWALAMEWSIFLQVCYNCSMNFPNIKGGFNLYFNKLTILI